MRITIIGAGIGGAGAGIALKRLGHEVTIYEQVTENKPVGAALSLWSNGVKVLNWLGVGEQVAAMGGDMATMAYRDGLTGDEWCRFSLAPVTEAAGQKPYPVPRAELQAMLMDAFGVDDIRFGMRLVGVGEEEGRALARFENGEVVDSDLLIGADGARSIVRDYVAGRQPRLYSGYTNFNGLVAADERIGPPDQWTTYVGEGKRCAVMPVGGERFYFFVDVPQPSGTPYDRAEGKRPMYDAFGHWGAPGVAALLDAIDPAVSFNRVEIWDITPFHTWAKGRVAILGDAAHNTSPDIGQGACSALEDVFALATTLAANTLSLEDSLGRYQRIRSPRAAELVMRARKRAEETHMLTPGVTEAWYDSLRGTDGAGILRGIIGNIEGNPIDLGL